MDTVNGTETIPVNYANYLPATLEILAILLAKSNPHSTTLVTADTMEPDFYSGLSEAKFAPQRYPKENEQYQGGSIFVGPLESGSGFKSPSYEFAILFGAGSSKNMDSNLNGKATHSFNLL